MQVKHTTSRRFTRSLQPARPSSLPRLSSSIETLSRPFCLVRSLAARTLLRALRAITGRYQSTRERYSRVISAVLWTAGTKTVFIIYGIYLLLFALFVVDENRYNPYKHGKTYVNHDMMILFNYYLLIGNLFFAR